MIVQCSCGWKGEQSMIKMMGDFFVCPECDLKFRAFPVAGFKISNRIAPETPRTRMPLMLLKQESEHLAPDEQFELARFIAPNIGYWLAPEPMNPDSPHAGKDDLLIWAVKDALEDCRNSGRGNEIVDARIIERIEEGLSQAIKAYEAAK